eukprot:1156793-Pelagomonas_calceolata.AAC.9
MWGSSAAMRISQELRKHLPTPPAPCHLPKVSSLLGWCRTVASSLSSTPESPLFTTRRATIAVTHLPSLMLSGLSYHETSASTALRKKHEMMEMDRTPYAAAGVVELNCGM